MTSTNLYQASHQWSTRPADERFESLHALAAFTGFQRQNSRQGVFDNRHLKCIPDVKDGVRGLCLVGPQGQPTHPTHHAFGQLAGRVKAPGGYLRTLPAPVAADCINYGLHVARDVEDLGVMIYRKPDGDVITRAVTGPNYGRVWNHEVADALVNRFGDGITGDWRVPGEFGKRVDITKDNTTLYAGEENMFVFLADEERRITIPNRRDGKSGAMARGFFVWNSEVGAGTLGAAFFLYDYVCCNRIVWGVSEFKEMRIRHTSGAPSKWLEEILPVLDSYSKSAAQPLVKAIEAARAKVLGDKMEEFLANRFGNRADHIAAIHVVEEGRPIETLWDVTVAATAFARSIPNMHDRVALERDAGLVMAMAA